LTNVCSTPSRSQNPIRFFARQLQQAIGGVEGEIRVCLQYFFQAWGARGPAKYRDILLNTATEEMSHIEMLATAVAMNLEDAPATLQESAVSANAIVGAVMGGERPRHVVEGMLHRHILSTGMAAFPANCDGVPFDCSHVYASGNLAADMYANVAAESTGRTRAVRLFNATADEGMQKMLSYLIARDTMHQQQWLAVIEDIGGTSALPIPNSFDRTKEAQEFA
jgi:Mn-containing catalase